MVIIVLLRYSLCEGSISLEKPTAAEHAPWAAVAVPTNAGALQISLIPPPGTKLAFTRALKGTNNLFFNAPLTISLNQRRSFDLRIYKYNL